MMNRDDVRRATMWGAGMLPALAGALALLLSAPGTAPGQSAPVPPGPMQPAIAPEAVEVPDLPPSAVRSQDPADSLYRVARSQMNSRRWADAARTLQVLRERHPRSTYTGDSYYFEALVRSRMDDPGEVRRAVDLLRLQQEVHPDAGTAGDGRELMVRLEARLAERGDARAARSVVAAARTASGCDAGSEGVRAAALSALLQMDPERARPLLLEVLRDRDPCTAELRERAVFILAQDPDEETVDLLVQLARTEPDPAIREVAVFWLSRSGGDAAVDALAAILEDDELPPELQEKAVFALGQHPGERAGAVLRRTATNPAVDPETRANAIFWMGQRGEDGADGFLRELFDDLDDPELRERVLYSIAQSPNRPETLAWLTARAMDENEAIELRKQALFWAGEGGMSPNEVLRVFRTAENAELREQAIFVLTQLPRSEVVVDALMEIARSEEDPELRERAVFWLGETDDPRVAEFLLELVRGGGGGR